MSTELPSAVDLSESSESTLVLLSVSGVLVSSASFFSVSAAAEFGSSSWTELK